MKNRLNNTIKSLLVGLAIFASFFVSHSQEIHPMTKAMLDGYDQILKETPDDYFILYQRSQQYYKLSMYDNALRDIKKAISLTDAKEKEMLSQEYSLQASIYMETNEYPKALEAIDEAIKFSSQPYSLLNTKGNICIYLAKYNEARLAFRQMQALNSRSQEAFLGLAKIALLEGDKNSAISLMKEGERCNPSSYITYCRLGDLYIDMGDHANAMTAYITAFSLSSDKDRPITSMINLSKIDYQSTINGLKYAIDKTTNKTPLYFLSASISFINGHYKDAYQTYTYIINTTEAHDAEIYARLAETCLYLNKQDEATKYINIAISGIESVDNYLIRAKIEYAKSNYNNALIASEKALELSQRKSTIALTYCALAKLELEQTDEAIMLLNEAIINDAGDMLPLMIRGYIYDQIKGNLRNSVNDYQRAASLEATTFPQIMYKGLAQTLAGKRLDGDETISQALKNMSLNAEAYFYCAIYYAQTGDKDKANSMLTKAIELGYENLYLLYEDETINLNIKPIRE